MSCLLITFVLNLLKKIAVYLEQTASNLLKSACYLLQIIRYLYEGAHPCLIYIPRILRKIIRGAIWLKSHLTLALRNGSRDISVKQNALEMWFYKIARRNLFQVIRFTINIIKNHKSYLDLLCTILTRWTLFRIMHWKN